MVKEFLSRRGVKYVEKDVAVDYQAAMEMVRHTGQEGVPVTVIDGEAVIGFDQARLDYLLTHAKASGPIKLGAAVADAAKMAEKLGEGITVGAYVGSVRPGTPAARIGLQKGDVIVELAGRPVRTAGDVEVAMKTVQAGQNVTLTYMRGRQRQRLQFVV